MKIHLQRSVVYKIMKITFFQILIGLIVSGVAYSSPSTAQDILEKQVSVSVQRESISNVLNYLKKNYNIQFIYSTNTINIDKVVSIQAADKTLKSLLDVLLIDNGVNYELIKNKILLTNLSSFPVKDLLKEDFNAEKITGIVKDENGQPIPGVTIKVKGQNTTVFSDANGKFKINAAIGQTLTVSFLGFKQKEVVITNNSLLEIKLVDSFTSLNEVVVLGYGSSKRIDLSSSSSTIGAKVFEDTPVATFDMALQGRAAGVQVTSSSGEPGGGVSIIIRGNNSVSASNQPLYVVDGFPLSPGEEATGNSNNGLGQQGAPSNPLAFINPNDIESVEVLKDAAATAIYGSRGANGVVLVTTKKGKIGKGVINLSYDTGIRRLTSFPEMMTGQEFAELWNETYYGSPFRGYFRPIPSNTRDRNWANEVLRDGVTQNALLSVSGGTKENTYNISGGYYKELGTMKTSKYERATLRLRTANQIAPRLNVTTLFNGSRTGNRRTSNGSGAVIGGDAILDVLRAKPVSDDFTDEQFINDDIVSNAYNPVNSLTRKDFTANTDFLISSQIKYNIAKGLDLNINPGVSFRESQRNIFFPSTEALGARVNGYASVATLSSQNYVLENFLTYVKTIKKKHDINLVAGFRGRRLVCSAIMPRRRIS
jgi:TonB-linked SusC/RagA family outer membrane protein